MELTVKATKGLAIRRKQIADLLTAIITGDDRPPFYRCPCCGNEGFEDEIHADDRAGANQSQTCDLDDAPTRDGALAFDRPFF
jgi:hypothetical protein